MSPCFKTITLDDIFMLFGTWEIHFWVGVVLALIGTAKFTLFIFKQKTHKFLNSFSFALIFTLFLSGLPLYLLVYFDISAQM